MKCIIWSLASVQLDLVLVSVQDSSMVCALCTIGSEMNIPYSHKSIWTHPIELLDHVCHMESRFNLFGDSVSLGARLVHDLRIMHHRLRNHYGSTR